MSRDEVGIGSNFGWEGTNYNVSEIIVHYLNENE